MRFLINLWLHHLLFGIQIYIRRGPLPWLMADEVVITYETLFELLRRERYRPELQVLPKTFFKDVVKYLSEKQSLLDSQQKKTSIFASAEIQKTRKQLENIQKILKEIYERREHKILQLALFASRTKEGPDFPEMLMEEHHLYTHLHELLARYQEGILHNLLSARPPHILSVTPPEQPKGLKSENQTKLVRLLAALPKFVGSDLEVYGPFEEAEIAALPADVADLLTKRKKAEPMSP